MERIETEEAENAKTSQKNALYIDIDSMPHEGFTSGLLITVREMIRRLKSYGFNAGIASIAQSKTEKGVTHRTEQGIDLTEKFLESIEEDDDAIRDSVRELIEEAVPDVIIMNTPAVFFSKTHLIALEETIRTGAKVVVMVVDELFPTTENFAKEKVDLYYKLLRSNNVQILTISDKIRKKFFEISGLESDFLPQLFDMENSLATSAGNRRYITLVNTHPIKGISVVSRVAKILRDREFMVVENWTDIPPYTPDTDNVVVRPLFRCVKDLYEIAKIILVPSLCNEGASRVVIEGMLNGIPVIAHNIGSLSEIGGDKIHLIKPPEIQGYRFEGTIMYPIIDDDEINKAAQDFADKIREIEEDYDNQADKSKTAGLSYCKRNDRLFKELTESWS